MLNADKVKILVAFDCSSQYRGTLITENLFYWLDLTNQLISVLKKFGLGLVASMVDIQTLFLQVKVQENQGLLLRFLWWNEGILVPESD